MIDLAYILWLKQVHLLKKEELERKAADNMAAIQRENTERFIRELGL